MSRRNPLGLQVFRVGLALCGIAAVALVVAAVAGAGDAAPLVFSALFLIAIAWNAYWWLDRVALEVRVRGGVLVARSLFRTRRMDLDDVVAIRPMRFAAIIVVIEGKQGQPIMTIAARGITDFVNELGKLKPQLPIELGWQARLEDPTRGGHKPS